MKLKLKEVVALPINSILSTKKLPFNVAYKLAKLARAVEREKEIYRKFMKDILEEYAERDEKGEFVYINDGAGIKIRKEALEECQRKTREIEEIEVEIEVELFEEDLEKIELSVGEMMALMPIINEKPVG